MMPADPDWDPEDCGPGSAPAEDEAEPSGSRRGRLLWWWLRRPAPTAAAAAAAPLRDPGRKRKFINKTNKNFNRLKTYYLC